MRKKAVKAMLGLCMAVTVISSSVPCFAEDAAQAETQMDVSETVPEETVEESESDFIEGSALLSDYGYEKGTITEAGWMSSFLNMQYVPKDGITMAITENEKLAEYYGRNGEDKKVADSEMAAMDKDGGYIQMSVEVNPNHESAADILAKFKTEEKLELNGKDKEMKLAGKTFLTVSGVIDKERYLLAVCTDQDNVVLAMKVKYKDSSARKDLMNGYAELDETGETVPENVVETEAAETESSVNTTMPEEFEDSTVIGDETVAE